MLRALLILTFTVAMLAPETVIASEPKLPQPIPAQGGLPEPVFAEQGAINTRVAAVAVLAARFWSDRLDTAVCPKGVAVYQVPHLGTAGLSGSQEATGRGWHNLRPDGTMACVVWLANSLVAALVPPSRKLDRPAWRAAWDEAIDACQTEVHEFGHAYGLQHSTTGVMAGEGAEPPMPHAWAPYACRTWASAMLRPYRKALKRPKRYTWAG